MHALGRWLAVAAVLAAPLLAHKPDFAPPRIFPAGADASFVVAADLNGDGLCDLAISDLGYSGANGAVTILLAKGAGGFEPAVSYPTIGGGGSLAMGDFNGDGKPDIVVAGEGLSILLGNGDGTFQPARSPWSGPAAMVWVTVGDFNHDGKQDLAVTLSDAGVFVFLGNGDATFQPPVYYRTQSYPSQVITGDFDGDGNLDLGLVSAGGIDLANHIPGAPAWHGGVSILLGCGDGTFKKARHYTTGINPCALAAHDFNGDGKLDLAVVDAGQPPAPGSLRILPGNGDGTFQTPRVYAKGIPGGSIALGDFDADGQIDVAIGGAGTANGALWIVPGRGDGSFGKPVSYPVAGDSSLVEDLAVGSFTPAKTPGLVVPEPASGTVALLLERAR